MLGVHSQGCIQFNEYLLQLHILDIVCIHLKGDAIHLS